MRGQKDLEKDKNKIYNTTDLDPETTFERHVFHRDQFAHYLRWSHILKVINARKDRDTLNLVDFGCGKGNLAEVLYRNRLSIASYVGLDIRQKTIDSANEKFKNVDWIRFQQADLVKDEVIFFGDIVCSFEVIEHVGKENAPTFLKNFRDMGRDDATYFLSTPNYDPEVGPAQNHVYNGMINEFDHFELAKLIEEAGFEIVHKYGTFASVKDYKNLLSPAQYEVYTQLKEYYNADLISVLMAPMFPEQSRNCLWELKRK
jgi:cyclopropane fatty-acyl-phospholipid synthase-like methyltransferase